MAVRGGAVVLYVLLAGCTSAPSGAFETTPPSARPDAAVAPEIEGSVAAPELEVGLAWTFEGKEFYNDDASFTVIVAEVRPDGYHFAGGAEDDLIYEALWHSRWYNERDRDLGRVGWDRPLLKFPLTDGATWAYSDSLTLTASRNAVDTPLGRDEAGFAIAGQNAAASLRAEYSPLVRNLVSLRILEADGAIRDDVRMTKVERGRAWVWYELGDVTPVSASAPGAFEVPAGFDHVIVSAGGTAGARARITAPDGGSWETSYDGAEVWRHGMLDATPGRWTAAVVGRPFRDGAPDLAWPVGWGYMHAAPIRWVR